VPGRGRALEETALQLPSNLIDYGSHMSSSKTWLKVILVLVAIGMLGMCAIAGAGIYFVSQHVNTERVSSSSALKQFDEALARFKDQKPFIEIDANERVRRLRDLADIKTAQTRATTLFVMAWEPDQGRIVNLRLPLWVLTVGQRKVDLGMGAESFDLQRLELDINEIMRVGSLLILDVQTRTGERVLIWTE
jgi:hypothetical protein